MSGQERAFVYRLAVETGLRWSEIRSLSCASFDFAKVPLATAQRLMRHSDPKLTAGIYTHVMIEGKAEALAKLPEITASTSEKEVVRKTGTDAATDSKIVVSEIDSCAMDFEDKIRTYVDGGNAPKTARAKMADNEKASVSQGKTEAYNIWWGEVGSNHRRRMPTDLQCAPRNIQQQVPA